MQILGNGYISVVKYMRYQFLAYYYITFHKIVNQGPFEIHQLKFK